MMQKQATEELVELAELAVSGNGGINEVEHAGGGNIRANGGNANGGDGGDANGGNACNFKCGANSD